MASLFTSTPGLKATGTLIHSVRGEPDGALVYTVEDFGSAAATPAYPGTGTGYCIDLVNAQVDGYFMNRATWKKPPATHTDKRTVHYHLPGSASFDGNQLILQPPSDPDILADHEVSYSTSQDTTLPFSIKFYATFLRFVDGVGFRQYAFDPKGTWRLLLAGC